MRQSALMDLCSKLWPKNSKCN